VTIGYFKRNIFLTIGLADNFFLRQARLGGDHLALLIVTTSFPLVDCLVACEALFEIAIIFGRWLSSDILLVGPRVPRLVGNDHRFKQTFLWILNLGDGLGCGDYIKVAVIW
jgi:hypothetical protein